MKFPPFAMVFLRKNEVSCFLQKIAWIFGYSGKAGGPFPCTVAGTIRRGGSLQNGVIHSIMAKKESNPSKGFPPGESPPEAEME